MTGARYTCAFNIQLWVVEILWKGIFITGFNKRSQGLVCRGEFAGILYSLERRND
jgi:hypothetical protein